MPQPQRNCPILQKEGFIAALVPNDLKLPALASLGELRDARPIICIDTREIQPLKFTRLQAVERALFTGDYSILGLEDSFSIERKSLDDLVNCCLSSSRERFEHELHRLRGFRFKRLLIIGSREDIASGLYHSRINPKSVLSTLAAFEIRYDLPVVFIGTPETAAREIERWVWWFSRRVVEDANNLLRGCTANLTPSAVPPACASASPG
jgi:ERCC4-type nuclease